MKAYELWQRARERSAMARDSGALQPIETTAETFDDESISFIVRVVASLGVKDEVRRALDIASRRSGGDDRPNPFLPYDEQLFVGEISKTHVCLLNKFNVIDDHLLIVTKEYEDQEQLLTLADFEALWACMDERDPQQLGFYNGGEAAGASQRHKHLQVIPLPLDERAPVLPMERAFLHTPTENSAPFTVPALPFDHRLTRFDERPQPQLLLDRYRHMMASMGLAGDGDRHLAPYNLLVTTSWMFLVPRTVEFYEGISVNAIGFAGGLLVRDQSQLELIRRVGPMTVLRHVARRTSESNKVPTAPHRRRG